MKTKHKFVGLDVHKDTIAIAIAESGREGEVRDYGTISGDLHALAERAARRWRSPARSEGRGERVPARAGGEPSKRPWARSAARA